MDSFEELIHPMPKDVFFTRYWGKQHFVLKGQCGPCVNWMKDLYTWDDFNKFEVLETARQSIVEYFADYHLEIGEPLYVSNLYNVIKRSIGVDDVIKVNVKQQTGDDYSDASFDIKQNMSPDNRILYVPEDLILEVKFLDVDIKGTVK